MFELGSLCTSTQNSVYELRSVWWMAFCGCKYVSGSAGKKQRIDKQYLYMAQCMAHHALQDEL